MELMFLCLHLKTPEALSGFIINIWKQGSLQPTTWQNNFVNMNKEGKMTPAFNFGGNLINLCHLHTFCAPTETLHYVFRLSVCLSILLPIHPSDRPLPWWPTNQHTVPSICLSQEVPSIFLIMYGRNGLQLGMLMYSISQEICTRFLLCCGYTLTDFLISIRLTSLALWQSNDCPSASKATLMNMDKYFIWIHYERLHNHNKAKHNKTVCIFLGIYCILSIFRTN